MHSSHRDACRSPQGSGGEGSPKLTLKSGGSFWQPKEPESEDSLSSSSSSSSKSKPSDDDREHASIINDQGADPTPSPGDPGDHI